MKKEHVALMQLEQALNNFSALISEEEDRVLDEKVWFSHFDEILVKLIDHRVLAQHHYQNIDSKIDWQDVRKALT